MFRHRLSRRQFVSQGIKAGAGVLLLPAFARGALSNPTVSANSHFFLIITLPVGSGVDSSYLFDARPLEMTAKNLIQNYRKSGEPTIWTGSNGVSTLATDITAPLAQYKSDFSILNGVIMAANFDGHDQNANYLYTGDAFGGENFVPHLNPTGLGHHPLDAIQRGGLRATLSNTSGTVPLDPQSAASLVDKLRALPPLDPSASLFKYLRSRFAAGAATGGSFAGGSTGMQASFDSSPELARMLSRLKISGGDDEASFIRMIGQFFAAGAAKGAILTLGVDEIKFDTHDATGARAQPQTYADLVDKLVTVLRTMRETPYDSGRSLLDVTTFLFSSEFGRTMRQPGKPMDATGTDHNPLSNMVLIGGKGIKGGQVIGSSDFAATGEVVSKAHVSLDRDQVKSMGRPFDFTKSISRMDLPADYKAVDYLGFNSVINTVYDRFGVPSNRMRLLERNGAVAPVIRALI